MSKGQRIPITTTAGTYFASPSSSLEPGDNALAPAVAWQILERVLDRPASLRELMVLTLSIRPLGTRSGNLVDRRVLEHAFRSGAWLLVAAKRPQALPVQDRPEPVAEQVRSARELKTWVEFEVVDESGQPMAGQAYLCMLPDGTLREGTTDRQGRVRFDGIDPGNCAFSLTRLSAERWKRG